MSWWDKSWASTWLDVLCQLIGLMQTPPINHRVTLELYGFVGWKACVDAWPLWISSSLLAGKKWLTQSWLTINTQPWINEGGHHTMAARHLREQARVQLVRALPHRTHPNSTYIIHPSFKCLLCCSITPPPAQCGHCNDILIISL